MEFLALKKQTKELKCSSVVSVEIQQEGQDALTLILEAVQLHCLTVLIVDTKLTLLDQRTLLKIRETGVFVVMAVSTGNDHSTVRALLRISERCHL
jgi:hypothetical protein